MPRLFISHSSVDNVQALAFQRWLVANGWSADDVFIDLHGIGAGERWRETLRKANARCEAVILLASPASLDSKECQRELTLAEDLGKPVLVVILRDLGKDDPRLARWAETQFVDLSAEPQERMEPFEYDSEVQRASFHLPALLSIKASLVQRGIAPDSFAWTPRDKDAGPYPGLSFFDERNAGIFFGREAEIMAGLGKLRLMRKRHTPRLLVIQAASGAGKSSYLRAGLWPRLLRDPDYAPLAILRPALGVLTGPDGFGRRFAPWLEKHGRPMAPADIHARLFQNDPGALAQFVADAVALATGIRRAGAPDARAPAPLIAIDQGEELFAAENAAESTRFLELLGALLRGGEGAHYSSSAPTDTDPSTGRAGPKMNNVFPSLDPSLHDLDPYVIITIRADSVEALLQRWPSLGLDPPEVLYLPPLSPDAYRDIIVKPAEVYSERVKRLTIEPALTATLARNTGGADALPLLAFTLERMFGEAAADGNLTLARYEAMGGMDGSIDRALAEARRKAGTAGSEAMLRRLVVPSLATWDPSANAAKRLVASGARLVGGDRSALVPLANALVDARLLTRGRDTLEVAHEALLRRPPIAGWLDALKDDLKLRDDVLKEAAEWVAAKQSPRDLVRRGERLAAARKLAASEVFKAELAPAGAYLAGCKKLEDAAARGARLTRAAIFMLMLGVILSLLGVIFRSQIDALRFSLWEERRYIAENIKPHVLTPEAERALKPGDIIHECGPKTRCPEMVVLPLGAFWMGSEAGKGDKDGSEYPQHKVTLGTKFAVSKYEVTWDDWEACVAMRGCDGAPTSDSGYERGQKPLINVSWDQASAYAAWLSRLTGKPYRLLSEAEWEYAARGVTSPDVPHPSYPWGDDPTSNCQHANGADQSYQRAGGTGTIADCDDGQVVTALVGKYPANAFGLYDMHGNVSEWVADGWHENYENNPPTDGAVWAQDADASRRVVRGGSWSGTPDYLRSALRSRGTPVNRGSNIGFRLARTL